MIQYVRWNLYVTFILDIIGCLCVMLLTTNRGGGGERQDYASLGQTDKLLLVNKYPVYSYIK